MLEGFRFVGIERDPDYAAIARARIEWWARWPAGTTTKEALKRKPKPAGEKREPADGAGQLGFDWGS